MRYRKANKAMPNPKSQIPNPNLAVPNPNLGGRRALVVGMAKSGLASVELLLKQGAQVRATDRKLDAAIVEKLAGLGVPLEVQSPDVFTGADLIVLSPGVPADLEPLAEAQR